jgi:hypothetical protein
MFGECLPHKHRLHRIHRYHGRRRFLTKEEKKELEKKKIEWIEQYGEFLEKELAGVKEYLEELKKE